MPEQSNNGLVHVASPHSVPETQKRLEAVLEYQQRERRFGLTSAQLPK